MMMMPSNALDPSNPNNSASLVPITTLRSNPRPQTNPQPTPPSRPQNGRQSTLAAQFEARVSQDTRIRLLLFFDKNSALLSSLFTTVLVGMTIASVTVEYESDCNANVKLWLCGTAARALIVTSLKIYHELITRHYISYDGNPQIFQKVIEMLDVFGVVWFCIGNLLVFNDSQCAGEIPLVFYTGLGYILVVYLCIFMYMAMRMSLAACPVPVDLNALLESMNETNTNASRRVVNWKEWLEAFGCKEMSYAAYIASLPSNSEQKAEATSSNKEAPTEGIEIQNLSVAPSTSSCPICLQDYEQTGECVECNGEDVEAGQACRLSGDQTVVSFPCPARHVFHAHCLHSWLAVADRRGANSTHTCPVCRFSATRPSTTTASTPGSTPVTAQTSLSRAERFSIGLQAAIVNPVASSLAMTSLLPEGQTSHV